MFSIKNISATQVAGLACVLTALMTGLGVMIAGGNLKIILAVSAVIGIASFLIVRFLVRIFIHRKIKLIYKLIYQTKATKKEEFYYKKILPRKTIEEVKEDVETWAQHHTEEFEILKKNE